MFHKCTKLFLLFTILTSCIEENRNKAKISWIPNEKLIDFDIQTVMTMDDIFELSDDESEKLHSDKFNPKTDTIIYKKNEIYITYLALTNGCAKYGGDLEIKNDTILLKLININDTECTEQSGDRVRFRIKNPENKRYTVIKW